MSRVRLAWHEAGHTYVARSLGRTVDRVTLDFNGGAVHEEAMAPNGLDDEAARSLVVVFAGPAAEALAPEDGGPLPVERNGGFTLSELESIAGLHVAAERASPTDEETIAHYVERLGQERVDEARRLAIELIERAHVLGYLERLSDALLIQGELSGGDVEELLRAPA